VPGIVGAVHDPHVPSVLVEQEVLYIFFLYLSS
jgi:hypothetical protein